MSIPLSIKLHKQGQYHYRTKTITTKILIHSQ